MISRIVVEGFKSIRDEVDVELAPLTILAGANSSGKSSLMQPLLLLKQSFEASSDPGPLLIAGANTQFSQVDQMFWSASKQDRVDWFRVGIYEPSEATTGVEIVFRKNADGRPPLEIVRCVWFVGGSRHVMVPDMNVADLTAPLRENIVLILDAIAELPGGNDKPKAKVKTERIRSLLGVTVELSERGFVARFPALLETIERALRRIIHVPALRGNPRRTYEVRAVGTEFPGVFHDYVASVIASWRPQKDSERLRRLGDDLKELGLTWRARTRQVSDADVEIRVGRLTSPRRGGARDLVSIADVGFGVSQALPVVVALLAASPGQTVYVEQPEIHLHPLAQVALANLLMRAAKRGVQVIAETHSELLLLGIQRLVAEGALKAEQVKLHWFVRDDEGVTHVQTADLDEQGAFGDWPVDFAETSMEAMRDYLEAAQREIEWPTA